jgi:antitoxin VapB
MPLSIKNVETERLARLVAKEAGESITQAIGNSLKERLDRLKHRSRRKVVAAKLEEILRRVDALPTRDNRKEEEILGYDSQGLPR